MAVLVCTVAGQWRVTFASASVHACISVSMHKYGHGRAKRLPGAPTCELVASLGNLHCAGSEGEAR